MGAPAESVTITMATNPTTSAQFSELLERHRGIVLKVARAYGRTSWDREDLAQEIATQLWRAFPTFDPARKFSTWMYRIALNIAISFARSDGRRSRNTVPFDEEAHDAPDPAAADPEDDERLRLLRSFIDRLDDLNRALLLLYLDDHSHRDIAEVLGISATNVATKIGRLKQRFRREAGSAQPEGESNGAR
jgi:RNA polymerase sigma-70 factor (ECF subfamily)